MNCSGLKINRMFTASLLFLSVWMNVYRPLESAATDSTAMYLNMRPALAPVMGGGGGVMMTPPSGITQEVPIPLQRTRYNVGRGSNDYCPQSAQTHADYSCNPTVSILQNAQTMNMMTQMAGSTATQTLGQTNMMKAQSGVTGSSQSNSMLAAANTQVLTGELQMSTGTGTLLMGAYQMMQAQKHEKQGQQFQTAANIDEGSLTQTAGRPMTDVQAAPGETLVNQIIDRHQLNPQTDRENPSLSVVVPPGSQNEQNTVRVLKVQEKIKRVGQDANNEQRSMANTAKASAIMSIMQGTQQMMMGGVSVAAGNALKNYANQMNTGDSKTAIISTGEDGQTNTPGQGPTVIQDKNKDSPLPIASARAMGETPPSGFGDGINPFALPSSVADGPPKGGFQAAAPQNAGGGGGGALGAGGGTSAASGEGNEEAQAKAASTPEGVRYEGGNGSYSAGGGNSRGKGDSGPDLSSLLEKFLPTKKDAEATHNIMQFGNESGALDGPLSLLDKNANLFERIHDNYQYQDKLGNMQTK